MLSLINRLIKKLDEIENEKKETAGGKIFLGMEISKETPANHRHHPKKVPAYDS